MDTEKNVLSQENRKRFLEIKEQALKKQKEEKSRFLEVKSDEVRQPPKSVEVKEITPQASLPQEKLETIRDERIETVVEINNSKYYLLLESENRGLELTATITPAQKGPVISVEDILKIFKDNKIQGDIDREKLRSFCSAACRGETKAKVLLVTGKAPINGQNERVDFLVQPTSDTTHFEKDEQGNIDYSNGHLFENTAPNQPIARLLPPDHGTPGLSVTGLQISASPGVKLEEPPQCGNAVKWDAETQTFIANQAGRIVYENNIILITDEFQINGDVAHMTGNIDFAGKVSIRGKVENGFTVKAGKGIQIHGNVGSSHLETEEGDIEIDGGMSAKEEGTIKCGGNLTARYLDNVNIECKGNITVVKEMVNCNVKCGGFIKLTSASIIGGDYMACSGIEAYDIGAELGAKTKLFVGTHYLLYERIKAIHQELKDIDKKSDTLAKKLDIFIKYPEELRKLADNRKLEVKGWAEELRDLKKQQTSLKEESEQLKEENKQKSNPIIIAHHAVYGGVKISFRPNVSHDTKTATRKPTTIIENSKNGLLRFTKEHRLSEKAFEIEKMIRRKEAEQEKKQQEQAARQQRKAAMHQSSSSK